MWYVGTSGAELALCQKMKIPLSTPFLVLLHAIHIVHSKKSTVDNNQSPGNFQILAVRLSQC